MASTTGAPYNLPYPQLPDEANVPKDVKALADAVAAALATMAATPAIFAAGYRTDPYTFPSSTDVSVGLQILAPSHANLPYSSATGFTTQRAGLYLVTGQVYWDKTTGGRRGLSIVHNGAIIKNVQSIYTDYAEVSQGVSEVFRCGVNDSVNCQVRVTGLPHTILPGSISTRMSIARVGI